MSNMSGVENLFVGFLATIWLTLFFSISQIPFIIVDLYVAYTDTTCVTQDISEMSITLKKWLEVDGYTMIAFVALKFLAIIASYKFDKLTSIFWRIVQSIYSFFTVAWLVVGAVLFWDYMDNQPCEGLVYHYTFARLVLGFIGLCCYNYASIRVVK